MFRVAFFVFFVLSSAISSPVGVSKSAMKKNIVLIGGPATGKGTQADKLRIKYGLCHLSTGQLIRQEIAKNETETAGLLKVILEEGGLVPDEIVFKMVSSKLDSDECKNGTIFDGFPRNIKQCEELELILTERNQTLSTSIELFTSVDVCIRRITGRLIHPASGRTYHTEFSPPKVPMTDDLTNEPLVKRGDDTELTVKARLEVYEQQTKPILEFYSAQKILHKINATAGIEEIFVQIETAIND